MPNLKKFFLYALSSLALILISGCSAHWNSIHHVDGLNSDAPTVVTVDAKQRFLISNPETKRTETERTETADGNATRTTTTVTVETMRRFCTEYSPDVFSILSQSASGSASFGQESDPKTLNAAIEGAFSSGEAGSTISRTQTINMLKEMMYRTCERYLNGQIKEFEYSAIAARDQRIMTSILAIEQLTGTLTPKPTVVAVTGESSNSRSVKEAMGILESARKGASAAKEALEEAQKKFAALGCQENDPDANATCTDANSTLNETKSAYQETSEYYAKQAAIAGKSEGQASRVAASVLSSSATSEADKQLEAARLKTIAQVALVVESIVEKSFRQKDETSFFCYRALQQSEDPRLRESCITFLVEQVKNESVNLELSNYETEQKLKTLKLRKELENFENDAFETYWSSRKEIHNTFDARGESVVAKAKLKQLEEAKTRENAYRIFKGLPAELQTALGAKEK